MKIKFLAFGMVAALGFASSVVNAAPVVVTGGTVHFKGDVVNAACAVDAGSANQPVEMGQVRTARLATVGATSNNVGFNIKLVDCDTTVSQEAAVSFSGTTEVGNMTALSLDGSSSGSATGVGLQILDRVGTALAMDGNTWSEATTLSDGSNVIPFSARYIATAATVKPGQANAMAVMTPTY